MSLEWLNEDQTALWVHAGHAQWRKFIEAFHNSRHLGRVGDHWLIEENYLQQRRVGDAIALMFAQPFDWNADVWPEIVATARCYKTSMDLFIDTLCGVRKNGTALFHHLQAWSQRHNLASISLNSTPSAIPYWRALGFAFDLDEHPEEQQAVNGLADIEDLRRIPHQDYLKQPKFKALYDHLNSLHLLADDRSFPMILRNPRFVPGA